MGHLDHQAHRVLDRIELRFGIDTKLRIRLHPIVMKVIALGKDDAERKPLLRMVAEAYAHHSRVREVLEDLEARLSQRITTNYAENLGIQPPNLEFD